MLTALALRHLQQKFRHKTNAVRTVTDQSEEIGVIIKNLTKG